MRLTNKRDSHDADTTLGDFYIDGHHQCVTLEDQPQNVKIAGETRIPAGPYRVTLRTVGGKHASYLAKFGADFHKGMLWIRDVPGFEYVLIHIGNDDDDTEACVLVGTSKVKNGKGGGTISGSKDAYMKIYPPIRDALLRGEEVTITVEDES